MKKLLYGVAMLATVLFAGSCQRENLEPAQTTNAVTFTVEAPGTLQTRSIADGMNVNELVYEVWLTEEVGQEDLSGETKKAERLYQAKTTLQDDGGVNRTSITLDLVNDQNFTILFWAQVNKPGEYEAAYNTEDLTAVTYAKDTYNSNDENLAAFYSVAFVKDCSHVDTDGKSISSKVYLRRPFAQLNLGTTNSKKLADGANAPTDDYTISLVSSAVEVTTANTVFNVSTSEVSEDAVVTFANAPVPTDPNVLTIKEGDKDVNYDYVAMNYLFAGDNASVEYDIVTKLNGNTEVTVNNTVDNVPLRENYRTNIIGNLLTSKVDYEIVVDANFDGTYVGPEFVEQPAYDEATKTWTITNADELAWVAASVNGTLGVQTKAGANKKDFKGETVVLDSDIDLQGIEWDPIGNADSKFSGTFDGQDHIISNFKVTEKAGYAGLFGEVYVGTVKNLTVKNVTIATDHYAGAIVGHGYIYMDNCHAENVNIKLTVDPEADGGKGDYGDKAGGLVGQNCEGGMTIINSSAKNVVIEGYRDLGGIVGMAQYGNIVKDNSVENITIIQNLENGYKSPIPTTLKAVIGRKGEKNGSTVTDENNTETDPIIIKTAIAPGVYPIAEDTEGNVKEYGVYSAEGLEWVAAEVTKNDGFAGKTITLTEDIDLFKGYMPDGDPVTTPPIGDKKGNENNENIAFKGTFDGAGHAIKNLYQNGWALNYEWGVYGSIGLFRELEGATVKNVVLEGMDACIEGGDISFIAGSATGDCTFENIEIKNSSIGTYNNGCGGIIGWSGAGTYTFKNIKLGSDVVLGGLWGSFDSSIGGIVGQAEPGATYNFENVEINCRIDAYNDCTASYDYYNYRMCGMIIGRCEETTTIDGTNYPDLSKYNITFKNVTVNFGDWMNYHYCDPTPGYNNGRGMRVEPGYAYDGLPEDYDHTQCTTHHMECIPFDYLIGGDQLGVKGITDYTPGVTLNGITVNYPESYLAEQKKVEAAAVSNIGNNGTITQNYVTLTQDITASASETSANSGYGATGVQLNSGVLDGNGKTLTITDANGTWDCVVTAKGGKIKNLTVAGAMRGIFMGSATADVYIDNVIFKDVIYTFNSDGGNKKFGVYISNSTLNGWTSHSDVHKEVVYTNCSFGEGNGYAFCRPYGPTTFTNCEFAEGFKVDARGKIVFENCTLGGVALTADNLATLVTSNTANATVK